MEYRFPTPCYQPYDGNGTFTVDQPSFTPGTSISSAATNANNTDFADGLTNCVTKDGQSTPTAAIPLHVDGVVYAADPDTGLHRTAANTQALFVNGIDIATVNGGGMVVHGVVISGSAANPDLQSQVSPLVGEIRMYGLTTVPTGWAVCDGSILSAASPLRTALLAAGSPYGSSGGNPLLPDFRGRAPYGRDTTGTRITIAGGNFNANVLGGSQDRQSKSLSIAEMPAHDHGGVTGNPTTSPQSGTSVAGTAAQYTSGANINGQTLNLPNHVHTIASQGSGTAFGIVPGALTVYFIIYVGA